MRQHGAVAPLSFGKRGEKFDDALAEIYRQREDRSDLNNNRVHFPVAAGQAHMQKSLADAQMRRGADGKKFGEAFDDAQKNTQQVVVQERFSPLNLAGSGFAGSGAGSRLRIS